ncbi:hypothetical protein TRVL_01429 [Trypanosoma vivax]|uniref:Uncharacterized protein n=1 Tax=Trypanosoma vivax (strain Y486) TaxID=1055687 RepID=G0U763_TRYVY|nr:hypothetical protein TRVL_01429 [Trypanosoma vivax]CCC51720.1 conserved hypothetical protein [Trypanosoma vivax Y486]
MRVSNTIPLPPPPPRDLYFYVKNLGFALVSGTIVKSSRLVEVMLRSKKVFKTALWLSYAFYAVFIVLWFYTAFFVQPRNPNWSETHKRLLQGITAIVCAAGLFWAIAVWPVYHLWTLPLGLVTVIFFLSVMSIIPSFGRKLKK